MAARLGALVLAVAMVVGAVVARRHIDRAAVVVRLTCATELADVCGRLPGRVKVTIAPAGTTADRLTALAPGADPGLDGWLTPGPWPQLVDAARVAASREPVFGSAVGPLARSPLA